LEEVIGMVYLKRKIDAYLTQWKQDAKHKPLIVKGPRQIGKTESVKRFITNNYDHVIYINFVEEPKYKMITADGYNAEAIIKNNQEICDTICRITEDLHKKELIPTHHITLCWHNDRLMRLTALTDNDDGKSRISKFARHSQRRAHHKGALPNHAGWVLDQETFFKNHDFTRSVAFFSCATNAAKHKQAIKVTLPAGLYLEMVFSGTFYENGNRLVKRITDFLEANKMTAVGDIYVLPLENHWFSCSCSQYVNKIFLRVVDQTPQEIY